MAETDNRLGNNQEEKIDIISSLVKGWKMFKKTWWLLLILVIVSAGVTFSCVKIFYTPIYEASASFTVSSGDASYNSDYMTSISMAQLSATFPYILESGALKNVVCEDLGVDTLPGTITASVLEETNLFQIKVTSENAQMASDILESVINNYPSVARYIIGNTVLTMLDNTGVPTYPVNSISLKKELIKGGLIACGIYLILLMIMAAARKTVSSEEDLKRYMSIRCLASIPKTYIKRRSSKHQQLMLIDHKVTPAFSEAISTLRIRVLRQLKERKEQVVLITSASESEGKTTIVCNLALSCALKGYRTLLIDGDLRNPSVDKQFGIHSSKGIEHVLNGEINAEETLVKYGDTSLDILPGVQPVHYNKVAALLNSDRMKQIIDRFRKEYDYIFIDTPPCNMMQDAAALTGVSDGVLMIIRQDYIARDRILAAMELLAETGVRILGYVINSEETGIGSYGYGRYGYGKYGYGKYGKEKYGYGSKSEKSEKNLKAMGNRAENGTK